MQLTAELIERTISDHFRKCEIAISIGLPLYAAVDGKPIPEGWKLDYETLYYLPPNVKLF